MIVWRGWGILVPVLVVVPILLLQLIADGAGGRGTYSASNGWLVPLGLLIAAPLIWLAGKRLNGGPERVLVDQQTGQQVRLRSDHSFFFVRMEYWAVIAAVAAVVMLIASVFSR